MPSLGDQLRVVLPWTLVSSEASEVRVPTGQAQRLARRLAFIVPWSMVAAGLTLALVGAVLAEQSGTEAEGSFGVEFGAALWFGGALTLGARDRASLGRMIALGALAIGGLGLVAGAVLLGWTGAGLTLAMEFGVGAVAVALIDVVLLGTIHRGLEHAGRAAVDTVTLQVRTAWPLVSLRMESADRPRGLAQPPSDA